MMGHKYQNDRLSIMYDFDYSYEDVDTKGIASKILADEDIAQRVTYIENWL